MICWPRNSFLFCIWRRRKEGHSEGTVTHYQCPCHTQGISNLGHRTMRSCLNLLVLSVSSASQSVSGTLINRSSQANSPTASSSPQLRDKKYISYHGDVVSVKWVSFDLGSWINGTVDQIKLTLLSVTLWEIVTQNYTCMHSVFLIYRSCHDFSFL